MRMDGLEAAINQERADRIKETNDTLDPMKAQIKSLKDGLKTEIKTREQREAEIEKKLMQDSQNLQNMLRQEQELRKETMNDLSEMLNQELSLQVKFVDNFENEATTTFKNTTGNLEQELKNRLKHQDTVVDDLAKFVGRFQDTLKVVGKDV